MVLPFLRPFEGDAVLHQHMSGNGKYTTFKLVEMRSGVLRDKYQGESGYLHIVSDEGFSSYRHENSHEYVKETKTKVMCTLEVSDILSTMKRCGVVLVKYDRNGYEYTTAVAKYAERASNMDDGGNGYLEWMKSNNKLLYDDIVAEMNS